MNNSENKKEITFKVGCLFPIVALLALLVLLEVLKIKTTIIIFLVIFITPLVIWICGAIVVLTITLLALLENSFKK